VGASEVRFTNGYSVPISVAYMRRDEGCRNTCGEPWDVLGWVNLQPGQTATRPNPTRNRWFYHYAEATDGRVWAGPYPAEVRRSRFQKCTCLGVIVINGDPSSPFHDVGFRVLDTDRFGGVNFVR
jgi:Protein of unknown function (DUF1036)